MNILLVTNLAPKWAGNQSLTRTVNGLAEAGHKVHVLSIRPPVGTPPSYDLHPNVEIHYRRLIPGWLKVLWVPARSALYWLEAVFSRRTVRASRYDTTSESPSAPVWGNSYSPAAPETRTLRLITEVAWLLFQVVGTLHGMLMTRRYRIDLFYGYEFSGAPVASLLGKLFRRPVVNRFQGTYLHPVLGRPRWWLSLLNLENVVAMKAPAGLVVMGDDGTHGEEILRRIGVPDSRVLSLTNGVEFGFYNPRLKPRDLKIEAGLAPDDFVLVTVSKLALWKRVDRAINALPDLVERVPNVRLVVVGDGRLRAALEQLAIKLGVRERVWFIGAVQHPEVKRFMHMADVFISLFDLSNRGNSLLEAMVCGQCIVTLDDGSVNDLIVDGETGVLISPGKVEEELPETLISLHGDARLRHRLGKAAQKKACERLMPVEERMRIEVEALSRLVSGTAGVEEERAR